MRIKLFDIHLPDGGHQCHVGYCNFTDLPFKREKVYPNFRILYLLNGSGRYWDETHDGLFLRPGAFLLRPPEHTHTLERFGDEPWLEFAIVLPAELYYKLLDLGFIPSAPLLHHWPVTVEAKLQIQNLFDHADRLTIDQSRTFLHELCGVFVSGTGHPTREKREQYVPQPILDSMELLSQNLEHSLTMPTVAKQVGMGYHSFRKAFTKHVGHSPKEFRIRRTIEKAQAFLLENPNAPLSDIAYQLGYPDPHTFSKQFKRVTGQSPGAFSAIS